jgi:hypothetical protein
MLAATNGQIPPSQWAVRLRALDARYLVLEKTDDWSSYQPLITGAGLHPLYSDDSIALYQL